MDKERRKILQNFANKNPKLFFALNKWVQVKNKDFGVWTALNVLYDASGGAEQKLKSMIAQLTSENKVRGRSQVYAEKNPEGMDIVNDTGTPRVVGYSEDFEASPKGQPQRNPAIFKKGDPSMQTKVQFRRKTDAVGDIGKAVRELYPEADADTLFRIISAIEIYCRDKKMGYKRILKRLKNGKLAFNDSTGCIETKLGESVEKRVIILSESTADDLRMSEYKFVENMKAFIRQLKDDPVNTQTSPRLSANGFGRAEAIRKLIEYGVLYKKNRISDKDEDGKPKTATMKVRFGVTDGMTAEKLRRTLKKMYMNEFDGASDEGINEACAAGGAMGGQTIGAGDYQFTAPAFPMMRRTGDPSLSRKSGDIVTGGTKKRKRKNK